MITRRRFAALLGAAGAGALVGCSDDDAGGSALTEATVQLSWLKDVSFAGTYIAVDRGWFADEGLDVDLRAGGPNVVVPPVVAAGTALVGMASTDVTAAARADRTPLKIVGARFQRNPFCIVSLPDRPLTAPADLAGARIGVSPTNTLAFRSFLGINDIPEDEVRQVPVQFDVNPLTRGEVDGLMGYFTSQPNALRVQGIEPATMMFASFGFDLYENVYIVTDATLERNRHLVEGFLAAEQRGWRANADEPELGVELTMGEFGGSDVGLDRSVQALENESQLELIRPESGTALLGLAPERIEANLSLLRDRLDIDAPDDLFDTSVLDALSERS